MGISITETEMKAIQELYAMIKDEFRVTDMMLFGSKARGDADEYSDVDLLVLTKKPKTKSDREKLSDITSEINIDYGVGISCIYFNVLDWESGDDVNPLLKENIVREGIAVNVS